MYLLISFTNNKIPHPLLLYLAHCLFLMDGRSTIDAVHIINQTIEKGNKYDIDMHLLFIDIMQAFDRLRREEIIQKAVKIKVPTKITKHIKMATKKKTQVQTQSTITYYFVINKWVRQQSNLTLKWIVLMT